jgi:fibronectin type 3 domain-containing protein
VYYGTTSGSYGQVKGSGLYVTNTTTTVPSLSSGSTYYFAVTAVDASGKESAYSAEATKVMP